ncbi:MAG: hypothetical protein GY694_11755 [Gammaproteobacteria bacterium]|nr:hypothetical protein [Gammaproteobacteria bacterium]
MANKKTYKILSKGNILPGFDKEQVIDNIHSITRIPKETIIRKFFSGKTVVIRHAYTQEDASQLQKKFSSTGIETYIHEFNEPVIAQNTESGSKPETKTNVTKDKKNRLKKSVAAIAILLIISVIVLTLITKDNLSEESSIATDPTSTPTKEKGFDHSTKPKKPSNNTQTNKRTNRPDWYALEEIKSLIKVTSDSELLMLFQFLSLINTNQETIDNISRVIKNSAKISKKTPLYIVTSDKNKKYDFSILLQTNKVLSEPEMAHIEKKLNSHKNNCPPTDLSSKVKIKVKNYNKNVIITSINEAAKLEEFQALIEQNQLKTQLLKIESLFSNINNNDSINFHFYYRNKNNSDFINLSSSSDVFWLKTKNDIKLKKQLNINTAVGNKRSELKKQNLFDLILFVMFYQPNNSFVEELLLKQKTNELEFEQQQISKLIKNYSAKDLQDYKKELDIDLFVQWQSGPFAITTNQFQFNKNLMIEILAKGQNIQNLMEYSQSSYLNINTVLNNEQKNILALDCTNKTQSNAYFKDLDGELEAYINDDFITYQSMTAKKFIPIQEGYSNKDIEKIKGDIVLRLPGNISQKTIDFNKKGTQVNIESFSLLLNSPSKTNTLNYHIIGNTDQFITIRAYNKSGDVIETIMLEHNTMFNNHLHSYRHQFSEAIDSIKVFYTQNNNTIKYDFSFKPEIPVTENLSLLKDEPHITFTGGDFKLSPVKKEIIEDNPAWLGEKWSGQILQAEDSPFSINLFIQKSNNKSLDSVLNLKSSYSPYIRQNITAVKLTLLEEDKPLINKFISFNENQFLPDEPEAIENAQVITTATTSYLNSNTAFKLDKNLLNKQKSKTLHGYISLSLPESFKTHSKEYTALGQIIKLDSLFIKAVHLDKHQIQFEIQGQIEKLVQLKLYNSEKALISEPFEFKHIEKNKALLTLLYNDKIKLITLVLSHKSAIKEYPFSFSN